MKSASKDDTAHKGFDFDLLVSLFVAAEKHVHHSLKWRVSPRHPDYAISVLRVLCNDFPRAKARIVLQAHIYFYPPKYSFWLLMGNQKITGLDVDPKRNHRNLLSKKSIGCTHWQYYPNFDAIPDEKQRNHRSWLDDFCKKCKITFHGKYDAPPHDKEQLELKW